MKLHGFSKERRGDEEKSKFNFVEKLGQEMAIKEPNEMKSLSRKRRIG